MSSVLDFEAEWCRREIARMKWERGEAEYVCDCWICCTAACEERKKQWKKDRENSLN
jgi:hypothetical protein